MNGIRAIQMEKDLKRKKFHCFSAHASLVGLVGARTLVLVLLRPRHRARKSELTHRPSGSQMVLSYLIELFIENVQFAGLGKKAKFGYSEKFSIQRNPSLLLSRTQFTLYITSKFGCSGILFVSFLVKRNLCLIQRRKFE